MPQVKLLSIITCATLLLVVCTKNSLGKYQEQDADYFSFNINEPLLGPLSTVLHQNRNKPAGRHGFIQSKSGHFTFEDGTQARFWGVNLNFGACFPNHADAKKIAKLLASLGINIVRFHSMDRWMEPNGILDKNGHLSQTQMDKLDYFIYMLKQEGIYVCMNLLVTRNFEKTNGIVEIKDMPLGGKPANLFDPTLIDLQKKYAKKIFTHKNFYTGLTYAKDPTIALVEIVNECSIFHYWYMGMLNKKNLPNRHRPIAKKYQRQLDPIQAQINCKRSKKVLEML